MEHENCQLVAKLTAGEGVQPGPANNSCSNVISAGQSDFPRWFTFMTALQNNFSFVIRKWFNR
jgi:hypothetical protein